MITEEELQEIENDPEILADADDTIHYLAAEIRELQKQLKHVMSFINTEVRPIESSPITKEEAAFLEEIGYKGDD